MTTFAFSTGNPANLTGGAPASMNDIQGPFNDLRTFLNGGNIDTTNLAAAIVAALAQPGDIKVTAVSAAPSGWLLCDGTAVSRTTYSALFSAIGTTYGVGDNTTTFNLPDLVGRVPVGQDAANVRLAGFGNLRGNTGGETLHVLTTPEIPAHTHGTGPAAAVGASGAPDTPAGTFRQGGALASGQTASAGGGGGHNNMQPYQIVNFLVKT